MGIGGHVPPLLELNSRAQIRIVILGCADDFLDAVFGDEIAAAGTAFNTKLREMERTD